MRKYVIAHVPHCSVRFPDNAVYDVDIQPFILRSTDWFTDDLFSSADQQVIFEFSRLWCDVERFWPDPLDAEGRGAYPLRSETGVEMRRFDEATHAQVKFDYEYHHRTLNDAIQYALPWSPVCLVDAHSFSDEQAPGPDLCIGTTGRTPPEMVEAIAAHFKDAGWTVDENVPYSGAWTPALFANEPTFSNIMFEINKRRYLDGTLRSAEFHQTKRLIAQALDIIRGDA